MAFVVEIVVLKGAFPSGVAISFDILATANRVHQSLGRPPAFAVRAIGSGARAARAFVGGEDAGGPASLIVVPGMAMTDEQQVADWLGRRDATEARRALIRAAESGVPIAAACSGTFLLASTGLLAGRRATTTWWLAPLFRRLHPSIDLDSEALIVSDGPFTTAGAAMAQLDLGLMIVAKFAGVELADACARYLLLDHRRSQARYMALGYLAVADDRVAQAERWARDRLETAFSVSDMAASAALSPRTFARRVERATGLSPVRFLQRLRVERAMELIETTKLSFEEIARRVGYADTSTLRRLIQQQTGSGPRSLRAG